MTHDLMIGAEESPQRPQPANGKCYFKTGPKKTGPTKIKPKSLPLKSIHLAGSVPLAWQACVAGFDLR